MKSLLCILIESFLYLISLCLIISCPPFHIEEIPTYGFTLFFLLLRTNLAFLIIFKCDAGAITSAQMLDAPLGNT